MTAKDARGRRTGKQLVRGAASAGVRGSGGGRGAAPANKVENSAIIINRPRGKRLRIYPAALPGYGAAALKALR